MFLECVEEHLFGELVVFCVGRDGMLVGKRGVPSRNASVESGRIVEGAQLTDEKHTNKQHIIGHTNMLRLI